MSKTYVKPDDTIFVRTYIQWWDYEVATSIAVQCTEFRRTKDDTMLWLDYINGENDSEKAKDCVIERMKQEYPDWNIRISFYYRNATEARERGIVGFNTGETKFIYGDEND